MRVKSKLLLLAIAVNFGLAVPAGATQEKVCPTPKELCDDGCTVAMEVQAALCSAHGLTAQAAVCHSINMAQYGGCLAQCHQDWGSGLNMSQVE